MPHTSIVVLSHATHRASGVFLVDRRLDDSVVPGKYTLLT